MKNKIFIAAAVLLLCSCEKEMLTNGEDVGKEGQFCCTPPVKLSLEVETRSKETMAECESSDLALSIHEETWTTTRVNVTGDEVTWDMEHPNVALYITDTNENLLKGNIPYNAENHDIYVDWHSTDGTMEEKNFTTGTIQNVNSESDFFWGEEWTSKPKDMPVNVHFYGYYPRAADGGRATSGDGLYYEPSSIIDRVSANKKGSDWNVLDFRFYSYQTKDNLSHHDVMYSIPEASDHDHRAGNRNKTKDDNIQLHFTHAFCLFGVSIIKGDNYTGEGKVSKITLQGNEIYNTGKLNIGHLTQDKEHTRITPGQKGQSITRFVSGDENSTTERFKTTMIIPPCKVGQNDPDGLKIICNIDGADYSCSIYSTIKDLEFKGGTMYHINLVLNPDGAVIVNVWDGGEITIDGQTYTGQQSVPLSQLNHEYDYTVNTNITGRKYYYVLYNGVEQNNIVKEKGKNKVYNVVVLPEETDWYATKNDYKDLRIHFDAEWHDKCYNKNNMASSPNPNVWSDLTGKGNDGILQAFDATTESGWNDVKTITLLGGKRPDGDDKKIVKGLCFDGIDDIVKYPGTLNTSEYTMSFVIYIDDVQEAEKKYYRLNAEGRYYPSFFVHQIDRNLHIYGHNIDTNLGVPGINDTYYEPFGKKKQYDFVYSSSTKTIQVYVNGSQQALKFTQNGSLETPQEIIEASLGGRTQDNSRSLKGVYFSFMLYDRALETSEIQKNYNLNKERFGAMTANGQ